MPLVRLASNTGPDTLKTPFSLGQHVIDSRLIVTSHLRLAAVPANFVTFFAHSILVKRSVSIGPPAILQPCPSSSPRAAKTGIGTNGISSTSEDDVRHTGKIVSSMQAGKNRQNVAIFMRPE